MNFAVATIKELKLFNFTIKKLKLVDFIIKKLKLVSFTIKHFVFTKLLNSNNNLLITLI